MDRNGDGTVTRQEYVDYMEQAIVTAFDADGDGTLSKAELTQVYKGKKGG